MAVVKGGGVLVWLAIAAVLASVVGAFAYLRVLVYLYAKEPSPGAPISIPMRSGYVMSALILASYFVLRIGLAPTAYLRLARAAAAPFFGS